MRYLLATVFCSFALTSSAAAGDPEWARAGGARIRTQDPRSATLFREGQLRSSTLRELVSRIDNSDLIVYIGMSAMKPNLAGRLTWMAHAGNFRFVRVSLNPELTSNQIIATLAHELQHAIEVSEDPTVVDEASMVTLYKRIGQPSRGLVKHGFETQAAQNTGNRVRRELVETPIAALRDQGSGTRDQGILIR